MQLSGKLAGLAVPGQVWFGFHFASVCLALILEDCHFRVSKGSFALLCFSALPSWKCWFCAVWMAWFRPGEFREFQEGGSPLWGSKFWGINQNLCSPASEDTEMLNEGLWGGASEQPQSSRAVLQGSRLQSWGGFEGFLGFTSHGIWQVIKCLQTDFALYDTSLCQDTWLGKEFHLFSLPEMLGN